MDLVKRWTLRLGALTTAAVLAVLVPTMAWASSHPDVMAVGDELAKKRRSGLGGLIGLPLLCCCVVVVGGAVLVVFLIRRRKQQTPPPPPQY
jgi:hypothetical protein